MKKLSTLPLAVLAFTITLYSCGNNQENQTQVEDENVLQEVKDREVIEEFLEREFDAETEAQNDPEAYEERKERRANTLKDISQSTYKTMSCEDILDSLQSCIKLYDQSGDLEVLSYFSDLQSDSYFKACLKSNEAFKNKFNDLYMELGEIRQKKEEEE